MDKVELISMNITTYIIQGQWNRFSRWTNVCYMMPEKPADMISGVLYSENFPLFAWIINNFTASA